MDTTSIEEVIGEFVTLKRAGSNFKAHSPFIDEKTPSFFVSPSKQIFKCFSSGKGGSAITFLMEHEKWTYPEALRYLAKKYNIDLEEKAETAEQIQAKSERESIAAVNNFANSFFQDALHKSEEGKNIGLSYFKERGFSDKIIEDFQLGYNPEKGGSLTQKAQEAQYNEAFLIKAGLSKEGRKGLYDFFFGRVVFPILNQSGQVVGFGARTLKSDKKIPKYLNSPENELYNKSRVLYGLYQAKNQITKADNCLLVEGYTDVISLHQNGIRNAVASSGTSLTKEQVKLIKRYTHNVTILFDGDTAGIKASFRGINLFLQEGLAVKACLFPDGEDPDSYAKSHSNEELEQFIAANSQDFVSFKTKILVGDQDLSDPIKKVAVVKELAETIAQISDALSRSVYCKACADLLDVSEELLLKEVNKDVRSKNRELLKGTPERGNPNREVFQSPSVAPPQAPTKKGLDASNLERELLRILLLYGDKTFLYKEYNEEEELIETEVAVRGFILDTLAADEIIFDSLQNQQMLQCIQQNEHPETYFKSNPNDALYSFYADLIYEQYELSPNWEKKHSIYTSTEAEKLDTAVKKTLYTYLLLRVEMEIRNIQEQLKTIKDEQELIDLLKSQKEYDLAKIQLSQELSRVIIR